MVRLPVGETHCRVRLVRAEVQSHTGGAVLNCSSRMKYVISMPTTCRVKMNEEVCYQNGNNMKGIMDY